MKDFFNSIEKRLGYQFKDHALLHLALIHRSYWNEHKDEVPGHNERLEFLGDSVLGLLIAEHLYLTLPGTPEGELTDLRSRLVEASSCARYLHLLGVDDALKLGRGEQMNVGKGRDSILSDLFEAIIGAIYLDGGYNAAKTFLFAHFAEEMETILQAPTRNWKAELQDYIQKYYQQIPVYTVLEESGPAHEKHFRVAVFLEDQQIGEGEGGSKKEAQTVAAEAALKELLRDG